MLLQEKLDLGTLNVMAKASTLANPETGNLEYLAGNSSISLCLWGNLSKNPR
jgi:Cancer susceptibility candidate 1 N-terminus